MYNIDWFRFMTSSKEDVGITEAVNFLLKLIIKNQRRLRTKEAEATNPKANTVVKVNAQGAKKTQCCS